MTRVVYAVRPTRYWRRPWKVVGYQPSGAEFVHGTFDNRSEARRECGLLTEAVTRYLNFCKLNQRMPDHG